MTSGISRPKAAPISAWASPPSGGLRNSDSASPLDNDVLQLHDGAPFQCSEVCFDSTEAVLLLSDGLLDLGSPQPQHSAKLLDRDVLGEDLPNLLQAEADVAQRHDAVESPQLVNAVEAVSAAGSTRSGVRRRTSS